MRENPITIETQDGPVAGETRRAIFVNHSTGDDTTDDNTTDGIDTGASLPNTGSGRAVSNRTGVGWLALLAAAVFGVRAARHDASLAGATKPCDRVGEDVLPPPPSPFRTHPVIKKTAALTCRGERRHEALRPLAFHGPVGLTPWLSTVTRVVGGTPLC